MASKGKTSKQGEATATDAALARVGEIEARIAALREKRKAAQDAFANAVDEATVTKARQDEIAVAVVGEDEDAVAEMAELEENLLTATRRIEVSRIARDRLDADIEEAAKEKKEAERLVHVAKAGALHTEIVEKADEVDAALAALVARLRELEDLRTRYRAAKIEGGNEGAYMTTPLDNTADWLARRIGDKYWSRPQNPMWTPRSLAEAIGHRRPEESGAA